MVAVWEKGAESKGWGAVVTEEPRKAGPSRSHGIRTYPEGKRK